MKAKKTGGVGAELETHFLAGRSFGPVVVFLNIVVSFLGGWVVVGVPQDTAANGFIMLGFLGLCSVCGTFFNVLVSRNLIPVFKV